MTSPVVASCAEYRSFACRMYMTPSYTIGSTCMPVDPGPAGANAHDHASRSSFTLSAVI